MSIRDMKTGADVGMGFSHWKVHEKEFLSADYIYTAVGDSVSCYLIIDATSTTEMHCIVQAVGDGNLKAYVMQSITASTVGTALAPVNFHCKGANTATTKFYHTPTSVTGTVWHQVYNPGGYKKRAIGSNVRSNGEFIIEDGTFALKVENLAGTASTVYIGCEFYEIEE
ncbi:MAG: hypothetical protein GY853_02070 [PVC group bacterium]|nr:hypothetical protein [PVC group bacterium]